MTTRKWAVAYEHRDRTAGTAHRSASDSGRAGPAGRHVRRGGGIAFSVKGTGSGDRNGQIQDCRAQNFRDAFEHWYTFIFLASGGGTARRYGNAGAGRRDYGGVVWR